MTPSRNRLLGGCLTLTALLVAFVGPATAHIEYVRPEDSQPANVAQFLIEAFTTPFIIAVLLGGFVAIVAGIAGYLLVRPFPADIAAFREIMDDYRDLLPWLFRLSMGMPMIGAGFGGYFFSPSVQLPYPTVLRLFGISVGFLLLFGLATRVVAVTTLLIYLAVLPAEPGLLLAFEYVPGLLAIALLGGGRPSADELIARMANDDRTLYSDFDPFYRRVAVPFAERIEPYTELVPTLLRVGIGIAFVYLGITQKLLRPGEALSVVAKYDLTAVVPVAPELWVIGAGLTEALVGVMFIVGAFTRGFSLVAFGLFVTTLFGLPDDPVVAHISLFGLVSALLITGGGPYSVDRWLKTRFDSAAQVVARENGEQSDPATADESVSGD
ncbi:DoxX family protein [Halonotius terrestris]|uniref:DoxX family protein n=1 Tax=Halonotius terrestris TaxID=2487750 RepID=A0A8J8PCC8_9EURY|nr:DoxX family protein [Halonotius terrestris]TQQ82597.1 DoxX family protein [Halonotius terrestris]